jgi:hypothetical protein
MSEPNQNMGQSRHESAALWLAGVRYPNGTTLWCAYRSGEAAWTSDKKLAARYLTSSSAAMAARQLMGYDTEPFWIADTPYRS